jgi:hypothetical protein
MVEQGIQTTGYPDTIKLSTVVLFVLGLITPLWLVTLPLFWFFAYKTFKSPNGTPLSKPDTRYETLPKEQNVSSKFEQIEQLKKLLDSGAITEEEFKTEKNKLLGS